MRQSQLDGDHENAKKQSSLSCLKINKKGSHSMRKPPRSPMSPLPRSLLSSPSPSPQGNGTSNMGGTRPPPRQPVIIYTHSPKVIHTNPKDFRALVQKLTGRPRSEEDKGSTIPKQDVDQVEKNDNFEESISNKRSFMVNDNEPSSMIIDDNMCYAQQFYDPPFDKMSLFNNMNSTDFLGSTTPFYSYPNSLFLMPNMRSSVSSPTSGLIPEYSEF